MGTAVQRVNNTNLKLAVGIQIRLESLATCKLQASTAAEKDSYQSVGRENAQNSILRRYIILQCQNGWDAISEALSMSRMSQTAQKSSIGFLARIVTPYHFILGKDALTLGQVC